MANAHDDTGRLNIYVSRDLWRKVKQAAAVRDLSVSEYCAQAIEARLTAEGSEPAAATDRSDPVAAARRFQKAHFGRTRFRVSTAELLRAGREEGAER